MNIKRVFLFSCIIAGIVFFCSCQSLDPFLFNGESLKEYLLDDYTGLSDCTSAISHLNNNGYPKPVTREIALNSGGETIYGVLCTKNTTPITSQDTIIYYCHGTSDHIDNYWPRTRLIFATGYPVLIIDYKGYGKSTGKPTEQGIFEDGNTFLSYIRDSLDNPSVIVYAYSLGSLVGCELTSTDTHNQIIQLILEAPIGSIETLVQDATFLNLPGSFVTSFTANNTEKIKLVTDPLLWIHGTKDEMLNLETNGQPIWNNHAGDVGYYITVHGGGHATIPELLTYSKYIKCLKDFIQDVSDKDPILIGKLSIK